ISNAIENQKVVNKAFKICNVDHALQDHKGVTKTIYIGEGYVERANLGVVITMIMRSSSFYIEQGCQVSAKHL
ncbi:hypothetical protein Tco_1443250, partial [Tanacetum coccineum]